MTFNDLASILAKAWDEAVLLQHRKDDCWRAVAIAAQQALSKPQPKVQKAKVKQVTEIIQILLNSGYQPSMDWSWHVEDGRPSFQARMFLSCGREPDPNFIWKDEWLVTPVNIPAKDAKVMVCDKLGSPWQRRYSFGELNKDGDLLCYNNGSSSWTSVEEDQGSCYSWEIWREPTPEELM